MEVEENTKMREIYLRDAARAMARILKPLVGRSGSEAVSPCGGYLAVANAMTVTVARFASCDRGQPRYIDSCPKDMRLY